MGARQGTPHVARRGIRAGAMRDGVRQGMAMAARQSGVSRRRVTAVAGGWRSGRGRYRRMAWWTQPLRGHGTVDAVVAGERRGESGRDGQECGNVLDDTQTDELASGIDWRGHKPVDVGPNRCVGNGASSGHPRQSIFVIHNIHFRV